MKNVLKNRIIMKRLAVMAVAVALVYFFWNQGIGNLFIMKLRSTKLLTFAVISISTAFRQSAFRRLCTVTF